MEPFQSALAQALDGIDPQPARLPIVSTLTGESLRGQEMGAAYWGQQIRQPVRFADAIDTLIEGDHTVFLEIGPHPVLSTAITECLRRRGRTGMVLASLRRAEPEQRQMLRSLGALYTGGWSPNWAPICPAGRPVDLPLYPWQRERYWIDRPEPASADDRGASPGAGNGASGHPLLGRHMLVANPPRTHVWDLVLDQQRMPYLGDHRIQGIVVAPTAVYLEMVQAAASESFGQRSYVLVELDLQKAIFLHEQHMQRVQLIISEDTQGTGSFAVYSQPIDTKLPDGAWTLHARGKIGWDSN